MSNVIDKIKRKNLQEGFKSHLPNLLRVASDGEQYVALLKVYPKDIYGCGIYKITYHKNDKNLEKYIKKYFDYDGRYYIISSDLYSTEFWANRAFNKILGLGFKEEDLMVFNL